MPTRLVRGDRPVAVLSFAEMEPHTVGVEELREYASEEGNPGNRRHVTGILVQLPSPRLREGVVLVDTPGVGSLARAGGAETLAYLPHCDLGVVLIDAASTLTPDDLTLLRLLCEAAIPAQVLLSKADLLAPADRERTARYIREQLHQELDLDLPVYPVSTVAADEALLTRWLEQAIEPLLLRHRALTEASLRRKLAHLRETVIAVLETLAARTGASTPDGRARSQGKAAKQLLEQADEAIRQARARCQDWRLDEPALVQVVVRDAAEAVVASAGQPESAGHDLVLQVLEQVLAERGRMAHGLVQELRQALAHALEALPQTGPLAAADTASVRDVTFRGLPTLDLRPLQATFHWSAPWWTSLFPRLALRAAGRGIEGELGPVLRQQVELYDRQLQAWLNGCLSQLVELYESQAEVLREQVRRLAAGAGAPEVAAAQALEENLQELRRTQPAEAESVGSQQQTVTRGA